MECSLLDRIGCTALVEPPDKNLGEMLDAAFLPRHVMVVPHVESPHHHETFPLLLIQVCVVPSVGKLVQDDQSVRIAHVDSQRIGAGAATEEALGPEPYIDATAEGAALSFDEATQLGYDVASTLGTRGRQVAE